MSQGQQYWYHCKGLVTRNTHVKYDSPMWCISKVVAQVKFFCGQVKSKSNLEVKVTRSKYWYRWKGLITRNTHVIYESPVSCHSKVIAQVKVF